MVDAALQDHQIGIESTAGTAVAATRKIYVDPGSKWKEERPVQPVKVSNSYDQNRGSVQGSVHATGDVSMPLDVRSICEIFMMAINGAPSKAQQAATAAYLWTFAPGTLKTATWEWDDGNTDWEIAYSIVDSLEITGNVKEGSISVKLGMLGDKMTSTTKTPGLSEWAINPLQGWEAKLYIDNLGATPGTTNIASTLIGYTFKLNNNLTPQWRADNTQNLKSVARAAREVEVQLLMEANASSDTEVTNWKAGTERLIRLELGNNKVIASTYKETVTLDIPGAFEEVDIDEDDDVVVVDAKIHNIYDITNAFGYQAKVMVDRAS